MPRRSPGKVFIGIMECMQCEADLLEFVGTTHPPGCFPGRLNGWEKESDQNANDRDDDEKLDKRKATLTSLFISIFHILYSKNKYYDHKK
jgi:hypothetical protein